MSNLANAVVAFITTMESMSGVPIAILERQDTTEMYWARTAAILCAKTGDKWCSSDVRFMTDNTEISGGSRIIEYKNTATGPTKKVCAITPPIRELHPTYIADLFGAGYSGPIHYPSGTITADWMMLYHAAHCLDTVFDGSEEKRAKAFATLAIALLDGNPTFTTGAEQSPWRELAIVSNDQAAYWAAGVGERVLLDLWKNQAAQELSKAYHCDARVAANTSIDIERIQRDRQLKQGEDCQPVANGNGGVAQNATGIVSDSNLWIWMYANGGIGAPPVTYTPMMTWGGDSKKAYTYIWQTASQLAVGN